MHPGYLFAGSTAAFDCSNDSARLALFDTQNGQLRVTSGWSSTLSAADAQTAVSFEKVEDAGTIEAGDETVTWDVEVFRLDQRKAEWTAASQFSVAPAGTFNHRIIAGSGMIAEISQNGGAIAESPQVSIYDLNGELVQITTATIGTGPSYRLVDGFLEQRSPDNRFSIETGQWSEGSMETHNGYTTYSDGFAARADGELVYGKEFDELHDMVHSADKMLVIAPEGVALYGLRDETALAESSSGETVNAMLGDSDGVGVDVTTERSSEAETLIGDFALLATGVFSIVP